MKPLTANGHSYIPTIEDAKAWYVEYLKGSGLMFCYDKFDYHIGADSDDRVVNAIEDAYEKLLDEMKV